MTEVAQTVPKVTTASSDPRWSPATSAAVVDILHYERGSRAFRDVLHTLLVAVRQVTLRGNFMHWRFNFTLYADWAVREAKIEVRFQPEDVETGERERLCLTHTILRPAVQGTYEIVSSPGSWTSGRVPPSVFRFNPSDVNPVALMQAYLDAVRATVAFVVLHELDECLFVAGMPGWYPTSEHDPLSPPQSMETESAEEWLEAVLQGAITLPVVSRDASTASTLVQLEAGSRRTGKLQVAVEGLFARLLAPGGSWSTELVRELCDLVVRLKLVDLASRVPDVVDKPDFRRRPFQQQVALLHVITDLERPVRKDFWEDLARLNPERYAILAVSALARNSVEAANVLVYLLPLHDRRVRDAFSALKTSHPGLGGGVEA